MTSIYLSLGSNINRYQHITAALDALQKYFGQMAVSPVYESEAVGFEGDHFLNLVVGFDSELPVGELSTLLRSIEQENGRRRDGPKFSSRTLDIDILTYGDSLGIIDGILLPRDEVTENAFVLLPLQDIAPEAIHPVTKKSYAELWQAYDQASQKLWPVDFDWKNKKISSV